MRRLLGGILIALAAAILIWELIETNDFEYWAPMLFGDVAFRLFPETLNLLQAVTQRYVADWVWDPGIQTVLLWPAWPVLGGVGLVFWLWGRLRRRV